jgi:hypothetical protein
MKVKQENYVYQGHFTKGVRNGYGKIITAHNDVYQGYFKDNKLSSGSVVYSNGDKFEGEFDENLHPLKTSAPHFLTYVPPK